MNIYMIFGCYNMNIKPDNLYDTIESYPELCQYLSDLCYKKNNERRWRHFGYEVAIICYGKHNVKYGPDDFYFGFRDRIKQKKFDEWKDKLAQYIKDNEHLHEFWML